MAIDDFVQDERTKVVVLEPYSRSIRLALPTLKKNTQLEIIEPTTPDEIDLAMSRLNRGIVLGTVSSIDEFKKKVEILKSIGREIVTEKVKVILTTTLEGAKVRAAFTKINRIGTLLEPMGGLVLLSVVFEELRKVGFTVKGQTRSYGGPIANQQINLRQIDQSFFDILEKSDLNDKVLAQIGQTITGENYRYSDPRLSELLNWKKVATVDAKDHLFAGVSSQLLTQGLFDPSELKNVWVFRGEDAPVFLRDKHEWQCAGNQPFMFETYGELPQIFKKYFSALAGQGLDLDRPVLIIDDMPRVRKLLVGVLQKIGFKQVVEAKDLEDAWTALNHHRAEIGLVICDWELGRAKGTELLIRLRKTGFGATIPFVLMVLESEQDAAIQSGFEITNELEMAIKPLDMYRLKQKTASALRKKGRLENTL